MPLFSELFISLGLTILCGLIGVLIAFLWKKAVSPALIKAAEIEHACSKAHCHKQCGYFFKVPAEHHDAYDHNDDGSQYDQQHDLLFS